MVKLDAQGRGESDLGSPDTISEGMINSFHTPFTMRAYEWAWDNSGMDFGSHWNNIVENPPKEMSLFW